MPALLIVEDDPQLRRKIVAILRDTLPGIQIFQAADAADAVRVMATEQPLAAVVDIKLPGTSGLELIRAIKRTSAATTVIINTNYDSLEYRLAAEKNGADFFLSKKNNPIKDLIDLADKVLRGRQADHSGRPEPSAGTIEEIS